MNKTVTKRRRRFCGVTAGWIRLGHVLRIAAFVHGKTLATNDRQRPVYSALPPGAYSWMRKLLNCQGSSRSTESASSEKLANRSRRLDTGSQSEGPECSSPK